MKFRLTLTITAVEQLELEARSLADAEERAAKIRAEWPSYQQPGRSAEVEVRVEPVDEETEARS